MGYAFVNFVDPRTAQEVAGRMEGREWSTLGHKRALSAAPARLQGVSANLRRFSESGPRARVSRALCGHLREISSPMVLSSGH